VAAVALIVPFGLPAPPIEILFPPVVATGIAAVWLQAWSWHAPRGPAGPPSTRWALPALLAALGVLLAIFQILLRPGVEFF
jgi:hypothetical protein